MGMKEKLRQALPTYTKTSINDKSLAEAAVLVPIFLKNGKYHVLFTRRSNRVPHHKGQVSFPGGARHKSDHSLEATALRETWEEIGLDPKDVEVLGELDKARTTTSSFVVSPFVAFIPYPYKFKRSCDEIDEIFDLPIEDLLNEANVKADRYIVGDSVFASYSYDCGRWVIWGATAEILHQFLEIWKSASGDQKGQA